MNKIDENSFYHETNEWIRKEESVYLIGITDFAQTVFGKIIAVELPEIGKTVEKNKELLVVESDKVTTEISSPLSGDIVSINKELINHPNYLNDSPYEKGWLVKIKITNDKELLELMNSDEYYKYMRVFYNK